MDAGPATVYLVNMAPDSRRSVSLLPVTTSKSQITLTSTSPAVKPTPQILPPSTLISHPQRRRLPNSKSEHKIFRLRWMSMKPSSGVCTKSLKIGTSDVQRESSQHLTLSQILADDDEATDEGYAQ